MQDEVKVSQAREIIDLDSLPPQIESLRAHAKERRGKGWLRSADNLEASAYLIETLAAEVARHRQQAERGEIWRPIETAPKDGTWFLAYESDSECAAHYACKFYGEDDYLGIMWSSACGQYVTSRPEPEFWQPLPPAPEAGQ